MHKRSIRFPLQLLAGLLLSTTVWANTGTITHLSGVVSVRKADGAPVAASAGTQVQGGDTITTGVGGFVRMEMSDGGEMILRPDSQLKIEAYSFDSAKPQEDKFVFSMLKGGLRALTGLVSKRGDHDAYRLKTPTATIGIRGTQFDGRVCQDSCGSLPNGDYFAVKSGAIQASNGAGSVLVPVGKVVFVPPLLPPVLLPRDPGIGFSPPAVIPKLNVKKLAAPAPAAGSADTAPAASKGGAASGGAAPGATEGGEKGGAAPSTSPSPASANDGANKPVATEECSVQ